jgi:50S ribosomal protein L16 3-hydroxylase
MLKQWLTPLPVPAFVTEFLRKQPLAMPGTAKAAVPLFDWDVLDGILGCCPPADVLVVARGEVLDVPPPRSLAETRALMAQGVGLVIKRGERHDPGLAGFAESLVQDLPGRVHVQLFVTPAGTHGFGWHYDHEDVFIAQTAGVKDYYFRDNTVDRDTPVDVQPDFETLFTHERSPLATARLIPGDWLYLPSRWWHMARCLDDSLSISAGMFPALPDSHAQRTPSK